MMSSGPRIFSCHLTRTSASSPGTNELNTRSWSSSSSSSLPDRTLPTVLVFVLTERPNTYLWFIGRGWGLRRVGGMREARRRYCSRGAWLDGVMQALLNTLLRSIPCTGSGKSCPSAIAPEGLRVKSWMPMPNGGSAERRRSRQMAISWCCAPSARSLGDRSQSSDSCFQGALDGSGHCTEKLHM